MKNRGILKMHQFITKTDGEMDMISYAPFYKTLLKKGITEYQLIFKHGVSANTLHRMKHGETITLKTLDTLCFILDCTVSDIIEYVSEE